MPPPPKDRDDRQSKRCVQGVISLIMGYFLHDFSQALFLASRVPRKGQGTRQVSGSESVFLGA